MTPNRARALGGVVGVLLALGWFLWQALRPPPCPGAVFVDLRPPLTEPGQYRIALAVGSRPPCHFDLTLPPAGAVDTSQCNMPLDLTVRGQGREAAIVSLTVGASPKVLGLRIEHQGELLVDTELEPHYAKYEARRQDDPRFCGRQARVAPACVRGSAQCTPFHPVCRGPADCPAGRVCCIAAERGHEYGHRAAARCTSRGDCDSTYGDLACHNDADCPRGSLCEKRPQKDFEPSVRTCRAR